MLCAFDFVLPSLKMMPLHESMRKCKCFLAAHPSSSSSSSSFSSSSARCWCYCVCWRKLYSRPLWCFEGTRRAEHTASEAPSLIQMPATLAGCFIFNDMDNMRGGGYKSGGCLIAF